MDLSEIGRSFVSSFLGPENTSGSADAWNAEVAQFRVEPREPVQRVDVTRPRQSTPLNQTALDAVEKAIGVDLSGTPAGTIDFLPNWNALDAKAREYGLSQEDVNQIKQLAPQGVAFLSNGKSVAFVNEAGLQEAADLFGLSKDEFRTMIVAQEATHAYMRERYDGVSGKEISAVDNELLGEIASMNVNRDKYLDVMLSTLVYSPDQESYGRNISLTSGAIRDTFEKYGIEGEGSRDPFSPNGFIEDLTAAASDPKNKGKTFQEFLQTTMEAYLEKNPPARPIDAKKLIAEIKDVMETRFRKAGEEVLRDLSGPVGGGSGQGQGPLV